ncbi:MAG: phosphoribosylanthranilate isomerase [Pseudomonadota bacterium]
MSHCSNQRRIRVKICGITRLEDALDAVDLGADALGFVFYRPSRRFIEPAEAAGIIERLPPFVTCVGLFMDADPRFVTDALGAAPLDLLQFHGRESAAECRRYQRPYIKAVPMNEDIDLEVYARRFDDSRGLLLDSTRFGHAGGSGKTFDWSEARALARPGRPIIMAGGLRPDNVVSCVEQTGCYGVDVSSGVETSPGLKDRHKLQQLFSALGARQV